MKYFKILPSVLTLFLLGSTLIAQTTITVPDDYATIQAAINAASPGDIVFVKNGTYTLSATIQVNKGITLEGESEAGVVIDASGNGTGYGILVQADDVTLKEFTLDPPIVSGSVGTSGGGGFPIHAQYNSVGPAKYNNLTIESITINNSNRTGFDIHGYDGVTVTNVTSTGAAYGNGIQFTGCSNVTVTGVNTSGNAWGGIAVYCSKAAYLNTGSDNVTVDFAANSIGEWIYVEDEFGLVNTNISILNYTYGINNEYSSDANYHGFITGSLNDAYTFAEFLNTKFSNTLSAVFDPLSNFFVKNTLSIQAAIDVAASGDVINLEAETFEEQVTIDGKDLTILGAGKTSTLINAPTTLNITFTTSQNQYCVVGIINNGSLIIKDLTVDGLGRGNGHYRFVGVGFRNAGGTVDNCNLLNIADTPFSGAQHGVALYVYNDDGTTRSMNILDSHLEGFQKNAMAVNADASTSIVVDISGNTIIGAGATGVTAQNGVQVQGALVSGSIEDNFVSGIEYTGEGWVATSILDFYSSCDILTNTVEDSHVGIYKINGEGSINNNNLTIVKNGNYADGIVATDPPDAVPSPFDLLELDSRNTGIPTDATLTLDINSNTVVFDGSDKSGTYGIEAYAGYGPDNISVTMLDNYVDGFEVGLLFYMLTDDVGVFTTAVANDNRLLNNDVAVYSNLDYLTVNAENNWWGTNIESEIQALIVGDVDYDPWKQSVTNASPILNPPGTDVTLTFTSLPPQTSAIVTVEQSTTLPSGAPSAPPDNAGAVSLYLDIVANGLANGTFLVTVEIDVSSIPGFDANTVVMYYSTTSESWVAVNGTYDAGPPATYTFEVDHFTPFAFVNPSNPIDLYLTADNTDETQTIFYPQVGMGDDITAPFSWSPVSPDWTYKNIKATYYVVPIGTQEIVAADFKVTWDPDKATLATVEAGDLFAPSGLFQYEDGTAGEVEINTANGSLNVAPGSDKYLAKLTFDLIEFGYNSFQFDDLDIRFYDNANDLQLSVFTTTHSASVKIYLGDFANTTDQLSGDGNINFTDLTPFAGAYWSEYDGDPAGYQSKFDVGPTNASGNYFALPTPDGVIEFEDLVIFAIGYGKDAASELPKMVDQQIILAAGQPEILGDNLRVPLMLSGNVLDVRAISLELNAGMELVNVEKAGALDNEYGFIIGKSDNGLVKVDLAVIGSENKALNGEGVIAYLNLRGNGDLSQGSVIARDSRNNQIETEYSGEGITLTPTVFNLSQNYPNPFNPSTRIEYQLPEQSAVKISVFNALGEKIADLVNQVQEPGYYKVEWNASVFASGVYFYRIEAGSFVSVKKMMLMK